jgi:hypothetical protein
MEHRYKIEGKENGDVAVLPHGSIDLFNNPSYDKNVLVYMDRDDFEVGGTKEYHFALELARNGFDVVVSTVPKLKYAGQASIVLDAMGDNSFSAELYSGAQEGDYFVSRDRFDDVRTSKCLTDMVREINEDLGMDSRRGYDRRVA